MPVTPMLTGVVDDNTILSNQRVIDMDNEIAMLEPDETPLVTFLMKLNKRSAYSQKVEWLEDEFHPRYTTSAGSFTNVATTVNVAAGTGAYFKINDVIRDELTGENMLVTNVVTDALTVTRGIGSVPGTASSGAADGIIRLSNASAEGALLPVLKQTKKTANFNYCQIIRTPFGMTETLIASKLYGQPDVMAYEANKKLAEHKREIENTLWMGRRLLDVSGAAPRAFMGGVTDFLTTNVATGGAMTQKVFEQFLIGTASTGPKVARFGGPAKVGFSAPLVMGALSSYAASRLSPPGLPTTWGVQLDTYRSANGFNVGLVEKRDWSDFATASPALGGSLIVLDMDSVVMRTLRDTALKPKRQANDEDSQKQEYLTEASFMLKQERKHAWLRGVTDWA